MTLIGSGFLTAPIVMPASALAYTSANNNPKAASLIPHGGWAYPRQLTPASAWGAPPPPGVPVPPSYLATPPVAASVDPYAPRPDAPIFRLQQSAPAEASPTEATPTRAPVAGGSRYYSVHRQAGRQPDAPRLPEPVYLDALPVDLSTPLASDDLAAPPAAPQMIRDASGRLRAVTDLEDPL